DHYHPQHIVTGSDFAFGKDRGGDAAKLQTWLAPHGIGVTAVPPALDEKGERYSATRARQLLQAGDPRGAAAILGRPWAVRGEVVRGDGRGKTIGFPTANMALGDYLRPAFGVYAIMAHPEGEGHRHAGVANIGVRPTVGGTTELLEFHLFDFAGTLYGQSW